MKDYKILDLAKNYAARYLDELPGKRVFPDEESLKQLEKLSVPLPDSSKDSEEILGICTPFFSF